MTLHASADSLGSELDYDYSYNVYGHETVEMARVPTYGVAEEASPHGIDTEPASHGPSGESDALLGERSQEPLIKKRE